MAPRWPIYQAAVARTRSKFSTTPTEVPSSLPPVASVALTSNEPDDTPALAIVMSKMNIDPALKHRIKDWNTFSQNHSVHTGHQTHSPAPAIKSLPIVTISPPSSSTSSSGKATQPMSSTYRTTTRILLTSQQKDTKASTSKRVSWGAELRDWPPDKQQTDNACRIGSRMMESVNRVAEGSSQRKPDTSDVVARRMIGAALGIKVPTKDDEKTATVSRAMRLESNKERMKYYDAWKAGNKS